MKNFNDKINFIWSIAELLRGPYKPNQYKDVMLPLVVLRRLDCVLEPTKDAVLEKYQSIKDGKVQNLDPILNKVAGHDFHNISKFTFKKLKGDPDNIAANLTAYIKSFSTNARDIFDKFDFEKEIEKLDKNDRLFLVISKFADDIDLHPDKVSNLEMGYIFEELIRRFNEASNEEAGDHFTPREVIKLMVNLIFTPDGDILTKRGIIKTLYDPAGGTGGMLSVSEEYVHALNPDARLELFGEDLNEQAYAICGSDLMIKGENLDHIHFGDSIKDNYFKGKTFDYMLANPPFGVEWKPQQVAIQKEHDEQGFGGRYGAGLPRISDGSFLFLMNMISKMKPNKEGGTRLAIVFNGSPLFTGSAGSGESEIRRWIIENDWLEAIVALPDQLFYNTGISTYLWIVTNRKEENRKGKIQMVNATSFFKKMRKSLGNKRNEICEDQRNQISKIYGDFKENEFVRIFDSTEFGYRRITVERPLRRNYAVADDRLARLQIGSKFVELATSKKRKDAKEIAAEEATGRQQQQAIINAVAPLKSLGVVRNREKFTKSLKDAFKKSNVAVAAPVFKEILESLSERDDTADVCVDSKGNPEPDSELRDYENVPLKEEIAPYMKREVLPHVPDAWVDETKTKTGYEINFNRYFYKYVPPRPLEEIEADLRKIEDEISQLLNGVNR
ncbi:MAG: class I SAM-dependent DNA methyltransferase [Methanoregula sp.]|nr:class I SAM-dependent DNA methyltransferase [Methanoregula sp.]